MRRGHSRHQIPIRTRLRTKRGHEVNLENSNELNLQILLQITNERLGTSRASLSKRRKVALAIFRHLIALRTFNQRRSSLKHNCFKWQELAHLYNQVSGFDFQMHEKCTQKEHDT